MKNNRKNRNKEKITNCNKYRLTKTISTKGFSKIPNEIKDDTLFIENQQKLLLSKCYKTAVAELNKWGLKNFYLEESKVENTLGQQGDDFVRDKFTLLVAVKYEIKFLN